MSGLKRLRTRLEEYYRTEGQADRVIITLPKGGYLPQFTRRVGDDGDTARSDGPHRPGRVRLLSPTVGVFGLGVVAGLAVSLLLPAGDTARDATSVPQFHPVVLTANGVLPSDVGTSVVLSPDGQAYAFVSMDAGGRTRLNYRRFDEQVATPLAETDGARVPFFSPDGAWIGFWAKGAVKKIPVEGGSPIVLHENADLQGASWAEDGTIVAALHPTGKLWRIPASPGEAAEVILDLSSVICPPVPG